MPRPEQVTVRPEYGGAEVVLRVRGDLGPRPARLVVRPILAKHLLDRGRVIVDLSAATLRWAPLVQLFPTTLAEAGGWPLARLVLAGAEPDTTKALRASRVHLTVPLAHDVDEARVMLGGRPRTDCVLHLALDPYRLHIAVRDRLPTGPAPAQRGSPDRHGFGLKIVKGLSHNWGVTPHKNGKTVWALLKTDAGTH